MEENSKEKGSEVEGPTPDVEMNSSSGETTELRIGPRGVPRGESGRELKRQRSQPVAVGQTVPTGAATEEVQPPAVSNESTVYTSRSGRVSQQRTISNAYKWTSTSKQQEGQV